MTAEGNIETVNKLWRSEHTPFRKIYDGFGVWERQHTVEHARLPSENITPEQCLQAIYDQFDLIRDCRIGDFDDPEEAVHYATHIEQIKSNIAEFSEYAQNAFVQADTKRGKKHPGLRKNNLDETITHSLKALHKQLTEDGVFDINGEIDEAKVYSYPLHDVLEDTEIPKEELVCKIEKITGRQGLAKEIADLVDGVTKVGSSQIEKKLRPEASQAEEKRTQQRQTTTKLMRNSIDADPRLIDIKTADFEDNQETDSSLPRLRRIIRAGLALDFYVPWSFEMGKRNRGQRIGEHALSILRSDWYRRCTEAVNQACTPEKLQKISDEVNMWFETAVRPTNNSLDLYDPLPFSVSVNRPSVYELYEQSGGRDITKEEAGPIITAVCENEEDVHRLYDFLVRQYGFYPEDDKFNPNSLLSHNKPVIKHFEINDTKNGQPGVLQLEISTVNMQLNPIDSTSPKWPLTKEQKEIAQKELERLQSTFQAAPESILERIKRGQILVYDKDGIPWPMPKDANVWDFAFSLARSLGHDAIYARIPDHENNGASKKVELTQKLENGVQYTIEAPRTGRLLLPSDMSKVTTQEAINAIHDRIQEQLRGDVLFPTEQEKEVLADETTSQKKKEELEKIIRNRQKRAIADDAVIEGRRRLAALYFEKRGKAADIHFELAFDADIQDEYSDLDQLFNLMGMVPLSLRKEDFMTSWEALEDEDRPHIKHGLDLAEKLIELRKNCPSLMVTLPDGTGQMAIIGSTTDKFDTSFQVRSKADNTGQLKNFALPQHVELLFTKGEPERVIEVANDLYMQFDQARIVYIDNSTEPPTEVEIERPPRIKRKQASFSTHGFE